MQSRTWPRWRYFYLPRNQRGLAEEAAGDREIGVVLLPDPWYDLYMLPIERSPPKSS